MAINLNRYVDIVSGVGAASSVSRRELIGRLFTTNVLLPTNSYVEMTSLADVSSFFGSSSEEYARALFYFGFISKNGVSANRISFARWADVDTSPRITGVSVATTLTAFQAITDGAFTISLGGVELVLTGLNFSAAASFADVASSIQTGIRTGTGTVYTNATVTYDAVNTRFIMVGGETGAYTVEVSAPATGTDILSAIGWGTSARFSDGVLAETVAEVLENSASASNNFGSFLFMPTLDEQQITDAATWNSGRNVEFMYCQAVTSDNAATISSNVESAGGTGLTLAGPTGQYHEMMPMMVLAATDYNARSSVQNYMFQQFTGVTKTVSSGANADFYDGIGVNYYGQTQSSGQQISFYQRGTLMGTSADPIDMNVYANEIWLKSASSAAILDILLSSARVSANDEGRGVILGSVQEIANEALLNGVISVGNSLSAAQQLYITQVTGDVNAYRQVATSGYWLNVTFREDAGEHIAVYTLVYAKDNVVRAVEGTHTLI